jgi:hypothetical protein
MPRGAKKGENRGQGRPKGSKNKAAIERELMEEQQRARRMGRVPEIQLGKDVIHQFMKFAADYAVKYQPSAPNAKWPAEQQKEFREWAKLACAWAKDLAPYQSPTLASVQISTRKDDDAEDDMIVIRTVEEMRIELLRQGVPPDALGRALLGPVIEHDPKEKEKVKKPTAGSTPAGSTKPGAVLFCEICRSKTLHVDGVCELSYLHKVSA